MGFEINEVRIGKLKPNLDLRRSSAVVVGG